MRRIRASSNAKGILAGFNAMLGRLQSRLGIKTVPDKATGAASSSAEASGSTRREQDTLDAHKKNPTTQSEQLRRTRQRLKKRERELAELRNTIAESKLSETRQVFERTRSMNDHGQRIPPFFVIGPPKSGTSWLVRMLNSHPEIFCISEGKFFGRDFKTLDPFSQWGPELVLATQGNNPRDNGWPSLYNVFADSRDLRHWLGINSYWIKNEDKDSHVKSLVRVAMDYLFNDIRANSGKRIIGDKTPYHIQYMDEIYELYPDGRIVHIVRDGRDQAVSSVFYWWAWAQDRGKVFPLTSESKARRDAYYEDRDSFGPEKRSIFDETSLRGLARSWSKNVGAAVDFGPRFFTDRYFEVRYEELLRRPEILFGEMVRFLGADDDKAVVEKCVAENSFERISGDRVRGTEDAKSFFRKGIAGDWKNYFTERDKRIFKEEAGELLIRLGYETNDGW